MTFDLAELFELHPEPMWVYAPETMAILEVNRAAVARYGYSRAEFLAMTVMNILTESEVARLPAWVAEGGPDLNDGGVWLHRYKTGQIVPVQARLHKIHFAGREARLVTAHDVSEMVRLQEENRSLLERERLARQNLESTANLLRVAGRSAHLGGWSVRRADGHAVWSDETCAIFEVPAGTCPTLAQALEFFGEADRSRLSEAYVACNRSGQPFDLLARMVSARGRQVWIRAIGEPMRAGDTIVGVHGAVQDVTELVEAREESRRLLTRLRDMLENTDDGYITLDHDWRFTYVNPAGLRLSGRRLDELIGVSLWDIVPADAGGTGEQNLRRAVAEQRRISFEYHSLRLDKWVESTVYPTIDGVAVFLRDITERRQRGEQLRLLESAISRLNDMVVITDGVEIDPPGPKIVYVNDAFILRTGYSSAEAVGNSPRLLQGPATSRAELDRIRDALRAGTTVRAELVNYTKAGEPYWIEVDIAPISDADGQRKMYVAVQRDITRRRATEEAMRISAERFRVVAQATTDAVWELNIAAGTVWWSEGLHAVFGHPVSEAAAPIAAWGNMIHPDDRPRILAAAVPLFKSGADSWSDEFRMFRADGSIALVSSRGAVIRDESGRAVRMVGSMVDITERRQLEEQLRQAQRLEAVGQLTGGVAHDFNNLLTVIMGNAELLADVHATDPGARNLATMIGNAAERGAELTRRLLAFARKQPLAPKATDINRLLTGMSALLRRTLGEQFDTAIVPAASLPLAQIDAPQLENAILNLCINARDAMPGGGTLTLETADVELDADYAAANAEVTPGHYVMIAVTDSGVGMPADFVARAFEPFFTTKEVGKGTGLGLSMVYGFVKQSRGHVKIYSEVGVGTTVNLYLPRAVDAGFVAEPDVAGDELPHGPEKILLVEDDEPVRLHVAALLQRLGYTVVGARNGPEALHLLRQIPDFDLLFTDIVMPGGMNGVQLAAEAGQLRADLPVLFTSGYTESALIHQDRLKEGVHLLNKPYRRQELARKVRAVLDQRRPA